MKYITPLLCAALLVLAPLARTQELPALVLDLGILGGPQITRASPPSSLDLGVELSRGAFFKLLRGGEILDAGLMNPGFNVVKLNVSGMFAGSGTAVFTLELMSGETIFRHELSLDIALDEDAGAPIIEGEPESKPRFQEKEYMISLYVDQQLVAASRRRTLDRISYNLKLPPMPRNYDPFNPDAHRDPLANSFSILSLVGLAAQMATRLLTKEEDASPTNPLRPLRQVRVTFNRMTPQGMEKPVSATVTLAHDKEKTPCPSPPFLP